MRNKTTWVACAAVVALAVLAAGCGGGGGGAMSAANSNNGLVSMLTTTIPGGQTGQAYSTVFEADFPHPPGVFLVVSGALPPGLKLDQQTGALTGYPRQVGSFTFEVAARDGADEVQAGGSLPTGRDVSYAEDKQRYTVQIQRGPPVILPQTPGTAQYRASYAYKVDVAGGTAPYVFAVTGGALPAGLALGLDGWLGGVPSQAQQEPYTFDVTVTDATGLQATATLSLRVVVLPLLILTSDPLPPAALGFHYDLELKLASAGGGAPYTWSQLPTGPGETLLAAIGLRISGDGHITEISGGPTVLGTFKFTLQVTDEPGQVAARQVSLKVNPGPVLSGITPNRAVAPGPYTVTGLNFQPGARLTFKPGLTETAIVPTYVNATTLTFTGPVPKPSDGSGAIPVMVTNPDGGNAVKAGAFVFPASSISFASKGFVASAISSSGLDAADVEGDGWADLVHSGAASYQPYSGGPSSTAGGLVLLKNLHTDPPTFTTVTLDTGNWYDVKFADVNVDGRPDVVALGASTVRVWLNGVSGNPAGTFTAGPTSSLPSGFLRPSEMSLGLVTNDAIPDLVFCVPHLSFAGYSNLNGAVHLMTGSGTGAFTIASSNTTGLPNTYGVNSVLLVDADGDGRCEVFAGRGMGASSGAPAWFSSTSTAGAMNGFGTVGAIVSSPYYGSTHGMCQGDFLGNGTKSVILLYDGSPNYSNARVMRLYSGGGLATEVNLTAASIVTKHIGALDADFDQYTDWVVSQKDGVLLVYRGSTRAVVQTLDAATGSPSLSSPNVGKIVGADINGDGRPDIVATTSFWGPHTMAANYGSTYTLTTDGNGGTMGLVWYLNTSN